jgi:hypothetical protein
MPKESIAVKLHRIENGISGALGSPKIQEKMAPLGYTPEKIEQGLALLNDVKQKTAVQVSKYGNQYLASDEVDAQMDAAYKGYMITVKVFRVAFKERPDLLAKFKVMGKRNRSLSGWLKDARIMYTNALADPEALAVLATFGYGVEKLEAERVAVEEIEALHSKRLTEKSEAQQGTIERDKAIDKLCDWYSDFRAIARIALYDSPQLLEALGIIVKGVKS